MSPARVRIIAFGIVVVVLAFAYLAKANHDLEAKVELLNEETINHAADQPATPVTNCAYFAATYFATAAKMKQFPAKPVDGIWVHEEVLGQFIDDDMNGQPHFWVVFGHYDHNALTIGDVFLMKMQDATGGGSGQQDYLLGWYYCLRVGDVVKITVKGDDTEIEREK